MLLMIYALCLFLSQKEPLLVEQAQDCFHDSYLIYPVASVQNA